MSYLSDKSVLYLFSKSYSLKAKNKKLYVFKLGEKIEEIPFFTLTTIVVNHKCEIDPQILQYATKNKISLIFIDGKFNFIASIKHPESKNIFLRKAQYEKFSDPRFALEMSKSTIAGKVINSCRLLKKKKQDQRLWLDLLGKARSIDEARGIEGAFTSYYFDEYGKLIKNSDFKWIGRHKHPAIGAVNSLLSWGYTLLGIEIQTFCEIIGLDPYLGYMHTDYYGRPSLVCDLMEEYRSWVVDKFVLNLINLNQIKITHFKDVHGQTKLSSEGYRIFQTAWLERMKGIKKYKVIYQTPLAIRGVIEIQTRLISKSILEEYIYEPFTLW